MSIPPYGVVYSALADTAKKPPNDVVTPSTWTNDFAALIASLETQIWPAWDYAKGVWRTGAATSKIETLTGADLRCIAQLNKRLDEPAEGTITPPPKHLSLFDLEDACGTDANVTNGRAHYLREDAIVDETMIRTANRLLPDLRPYIHKTKFLFQRPRPAQMSLLLNVPIKVEYASSSLTPALVSGHALQGIVLLTDVYLQALQQKDPLPAPEKTIAMQWAVGIGDRRVFAGVHYPSDNFASWFVASQLAKTLWPGKEREAKAFMWKAISDHSSVYGETVGHTEFKALRTWMADAFTK
jgi:hypothetical protein